MCSSSAEIRAQSMGTAQDAPPELSPEAPTRTYILEPPISISAMLMCFSAKAPSHRASARSKVQRAVVFRCLSFHDFRLAVMRRRWASSYKALAAFADAVVNVISGDAYIAMLKISPVWGATKDILQRRRAACVFARRKSISLKYQ